MTEQLRPLPGFMRLIQLLSMSVWVGGIVFFAFVLAPTAFQLLSIHDAGMVVGAALRIFDVVSMSWGLLFLFATWNLVRHRPRDVCRFCRIQFVAALVMVLATAWLHWGILAAMEDDRLHAGGDIARLGPHDVTRIHFNVLHALSEGTESFILILGLGVLFLLSREMSPRPPTPITEA